MNRLKNKDGSAILWTVLLTIIITILLGTLLTLSYGYHNSTIATVKKQQAYFTARSATDMVIAELGTYGSESKLMPRRNGATLKIDDFGFAEGMGTAKAEIKKASDDTVEVKVIAAYADSKYTMTATLKNQSLFFGGIAVRNLDVPATSTFTLTENTDLYIDNASGFSGRLNVGGNLICRGNITLLAGSSVSGTTFEQNTTYDNNLATTHPQKQIWSPSKYIISNYDISVKYPQVVQTTRMLVSSILTGNYDREACNNVYGMAFDPNLLDNLDMTKFALTNSSRYVKITNFDSITGRYFAEQGIADRAYTSVNDWWVFPYKGWKVSDGVYASDGWSQATYVNYAAVPGWYNYVTPGTVGGVSRFLRNDTYDVNQFKFSSSGWLDDKDDVTSVAYILVDKNCKLRVKYGLNQEYSGFLGSLTDAIDAMNKKKISYLYVYLDDGAIIELGNTAGSTAEDLRRLNFYMTIYGTENSTVILHNNVKVHGSINVGTLSVKPGANVTVNYITSNGGQVAKQKVDELWTISNYSE